ncbi:MAG: hypothetical protein M3N33_06245 [Actinomycetota bacterium]|nr:hypothetical protein [Actinomycetota bacterium]
MDEHGLARMVGWVSLGLGLALVVSPASTVKRLGMGERPNLGVSWASGTSSSAPGCCAAGARPPD